MVNNSLIQTNKLQYPNPSKFKIIGVKNPKHNAVTICSYLYCMYSKKLAIIRYFEPQSMLENRLIVGGLR